MSIKHCLDNVREHYTPGNSRTLSLASFKTKTAGIYRRGDWLLSLGDRNKFKIGETKIFVKFRAEAEGKSRR